MKRRCIVLLSGGLDSMLAIRIMQEQGIEVEALNFKTIFTCCQDHAGQAACDLGVRLTVIGQDDDYLDLVKSPRFGYGKGANPCVDCRIYMFERARRFMQQINADFIASGEVLGQRPMSQKRRDLDTISYHADLEDLLLRPLSARLLPPTLPEREGWVDRQRLYAFQGRSRKGLLELAEQLGLENTPAPSTGCVLTEPRFSQKVFDLIRAPDESQRWDFELLQLGRHFRHDAHTKIVVGRNEPENVQLKYMHERPEASSTALLLPQNFPGPQALIMGPVTAAALDFAGALTLRYSNQFDPHNALILVAQKDQTHLMRAVSSDEGRAAKTLAS